MAEIVVLDDLPEASFDLSEDEGNAPPVKRRGRALVFTKDETVADSEAAQALVKKGCWRQRRRNETAEGIKVYYECSQTKRHNAKCPKEMYLLYHHANESVSVYYTDGEHDHVGTRGLSDQTKQKVRELIASGVPAMVKRIMTSLRDSDHQPLPTEMQLKSFLNYALQQQHGPAQISLSELEKLCQELSVMPEDEDKPYVVAYEVVRANERANFGDLDSGDDSSTDDVSTAEHQFRLLLSTKRLLKVFQQGSVIHADATYKLIWQGYPVLVVGCSDHARQFHPMGFAVCTNEKTADFEFVFRALKSGVEAVMPVGSIYQPTTLVADSAPSITNGFSKVFGEPKNRINYFAHVKTGKNGLNKKVCRIKDAVVSKLLLQDVDCLQIATSLLEFEAASQLFLEKWEGHDDDDVRQVVGDFKQNWLERNSSWFEGYAPGAPSTNNCLEATNHSIKRDGTVRKRIALRRFISLACDKIVAPWSKERQEQAGGKKFVAEPAFFSRQLQTKAWQWIRTKAAVKTENKDGTTTCYVPSSQLGGFPDLTPADVELHRGRRDERNWPDFASYFKHRHGGIWEVRIPAVEWKQGSCTCRIFLKERACKHLLGCAHRLAVGQKRKRGRPSLARPALIRD